MIPKQKVTNGTVLCRRRSRKIRVLPGPQEGDDPILEGQRAIRRVYRDVLEQDGYEVLVAADGEEGWETILNQKPSLVLLDLGLPLLDGFKVLEKILRNDQTKGIPVIIFFVLGEPRDIKKALEMGPTIIR
jgi:DNA-binding response OmpR family regulator